MLYGKELGVVINFATERGLIYNVVDQNAGVRHLITSLPDQQRRLYLKLLEEILKETLADLKYQIKSPYP